MSDLAVWFTDGTPEDLESRARHLAIISPLSYEDAKREIVRFTAAMQSVIRAVDGCAREIAGLRRAWGYETPAHSRMHAAYRAKTRRRNRR